MKTVLIVEPVSSGWKLITKGKQFGHKIVVLTHNQGDRVIPEEFLQAADEVIIADTNDDQAALNAAVALHERMALDAVIPGFEYYVPLASQINAKLGLRGLDPAHVINLRHKDCMRDALHAAGVRVPRFRLVSEPGELDAAIDYVQYPSVIKPVDCSGSFNVRKVSERAELIEGFQAIYSTEITDLGRVARRDVLLEEYVSGPEYSIEGYVEGEEITFLSITEKLLTPEPYFVEVGHIVSADLAPEIEKAIYDYVTDVIKALHVTVGPFHCELRLAEDGPVVIEIGARLAGDRICDLIEYAKGVDLYKVMFDSYLGLPHGIDKKVVLNRRKFAGIKFFVRPGLKTYSSVEGLENVKGTAGFQEMRITSQPGTEIPEPTSFMGRLGFTIFTNDSYEELKTTLDEADRVVQFS